MAQMAKLWLSMQETQVRSQDQEDLPGEWNGYPLIILAWRIPQRRRLVAVGVVWGHKVRHS